MLKFNDDDTRVHRFGHPLSIVIETIPPPHFLELPYQAPPLLTFLLWLLLYLLHRHAFSFIVNTKITIFTYLHS